MSKEHSKKSSDVLIVQVKKIPIYATDLNELSEVERAFFSTLDFALSECVIAARLLYMSNPEKKSQRNGLGRDEQTIYLHRLRSSQFEFLLRIWISKIFEAMQFLEDSLKFEDVALELNLKDRIREIKNGDGFSVARIVRNESANHFLIKTAKKNAPFQSELTGFEVYDCKNNALNNHYSGGQDLHFYSRIDRHISSSELESVGEALGASIDWAILAQQLITEVYNNALKEFLADKISYRHAEKFDFEIPTSVSAKGGTLPYFWAYTSNTKSDAT